MANSLVKVKRRKINGGIDVYKMVEKENIKNAIRAQAEAINNRAKMLAPYDASKPKSALHLKYNGRVVHEDNRSIVIYGDAKIPYARIHEFGGMTGRGYRTRIIAKHYLERAVTQVKKEGIKKFKKK